MDHPHMAKHLAKYCCQERSTLHSLADKPWHCAPRVAVLFGPKSRASIVALEAKSAAIYRAPP